jgi:hypothetical protein
MTGFLGHVFMSQLLGVCDAIHEHDSLDREQTRVERDVI